MSKAELDRARSLTTAEAAAILRLSVRQIANLVNAGKLTPIRFGRTVRFSQGEIARVEQVRASA